jgi:uncharacterized protein (DUF58 family)
VSASPAPAPRSAAPTGAGGRAARDRAGYPQRVTLEALIGLKAAGESLKLGSIRVRALVSGGHLSSFKGRGVEFDESRPYQPGDDLRTMDWRVTARTGKPHTKVFREERNRPVMVWVDLRGSMMFGTRAAFKGVRAAEAAALIAWSAIGNGDRFGGLVFSETEHHELRPRLGRRAALQLLQLVSAEPFWSSAGGGEGGRENADHALLRLTRVARPGGLIFLLSDFRGLGPDAERHIRQLARHGEVFLVHFFDPVEAELPPAGRYRIKAGKRSFTVDTGDPALRAEYRGRFEARRAALEALARLQSVHLIECATTDDPRKVLTERFKNR